MHAHIEPEPVRRVSSVDEAWGVALWFGCRNFVVIPEGTPLSEGGEVAYGAFGLQEVCNRLLQDGRAVIIGLARDTCAFRE